MAARSLSLRSVVPKCLTSGFEQKLTQGVLRRVEAKQLLFAEGDAVTHLYRIETGAIALQVLADRRRQVMGFAYPGDLVGLGIEGEHVMNAQAIKPTRVRCLAIASLRQSIADDPTLGFKLYEALARELATTRDLVLTTGQRSAERASGFFASQSTQCPRSDELRTADDPYRYRRLPRSDHRDG